MRGLDLQALTPAIVATLLLVLIGLLFPGLVARYHQHQVLPHLLAGDYSGAESMLAQVRRWLPTYFFANDHLRLSLAEGELHFRRAEQATTLRDFLTHMQAAKTSYQQASALQPRDLQALTGLARSVEALERVYPTLEKQPYPESARPIFAELLRLMPSNIYAHSLYIQYLHHRQVSTEELHATIARSVYLFPSLYFQLVNQPFSTPELDGILAEMLETALGEQIMADEALRALADLALRRGDADSAAAWYRQSIPNQTFRDTSQLYLHLGGLHLQAEDFQAAEAAFLQALYRSDREAKLRRIHATYARHGSDRQFLDFANLVEKSYPIAEYLELLRAEALIAFGQPALATARLLRITDRDYQAESYYLLARIAEKAQDWDEMELKAQRATVLAPNNPSYHRLFAQALQRQKKIPQAEKAAAVAATLTEQQKQRHNRQAEH